MVHHVGFSHHGCRCHHPRFRSACRHVHRRSYHSRSWNPLLHHLWCCSNRRAGIPQGASYLDLTFQLFLLCWSNPCFCCSSGHHFHQDKLGLANPFSFANLPSLVQIATVFLLPESPRFLISKDRTEEAAAILVKYHAEGDANSPLVQAEIVQIRETIKAEMEASKQSWLSVIRTAGMRRRFLVTVFIGLFTQLSGNTLMSYYSGKLFELMGYTSDYTKTRINLAFACWSLMNATALALIVPRFKRRHMYMLSATLMLLVFIAITVSLQQIQATPVGQKNNAAGIAALFFYFAYSPTYNIGNNALTYTYLVELWPYAMRSRGIGVQQIFGKLAGFFSTNVNSIALDAIKWKYLAIYCGWIVFEFLIIYLLYPETSGRTLEELTFLFEDDELKEKATAAVEKQIHFGDAKEEENKTQVQTREVA
ncbi:hypothetical protein SNK04_011841 [Fusarium graminearum]